MESPSTARLGPVEYRFENGTIFVERPCAPVPRRIPGETEIRPHPVDRVGAAPQC